MSVQMLAMVCDPRLYVEIHGVPENKREQLLFMFQKAVCDLAVKNAVEQDT